jgi:FMN-dependent NADH-azoreductase
LCNWKITAVPQVNHGLYGNKDFESIVVEGDDAIPDRAQEFRAAAVEKARNATVRF